MTLPGGQPAPPPDHDPLSVLCDALDTHGQITIALTDTTQIGPRCGVVDRDNAVILINRDKMYGKRRATLYHEVTHLACPDCDEDEVEHRTAAALVPLHDAAAVAGGLADAHEVAARHDVDAQLVRARIAGFGVTAGFGEAG